MAFDKNKTFGLIADELNEQLEQIKKDAAAKKVSRAEILESAKACVCQDRKDAYGDLEDNFEKIADLWNAYLAGWDFMEISLSGYDVANMMILLKVARNAANPTHTDNWVDIAGYAACGGELVTSF